jgi:hypothetical protein
MNKGPSYYDVLGVSRWAVGHVRVLPCTHAVLTADCACRSADDVEIKKA